MEQLELPFDSLRDKFIKKAKRLIQEQINRYGHGNTFEYILGSFDSYAFDKELQIDMFENIRIKDTVGSTHLIWWKE